MTLVEKARVFATAAHAGQVRKYTGVPYITHPIEVAKILRKVEHTEAQLCAALLHDTLEDTKVTESLLREEFGDEITSLVKWLTDVSTPADGNRAARKALDRAHIAKAPAEAQTVKLADLISNTQSIAANDKKFAAVYVKEKRALLDVLQKADKYLWNDAYDLVVAVEESLL